MDPILIRSDLSTVSSLVSYANGPYGMTLIKMKIVTTTLTERTAEP